MTTAAAHSSCSCAARLPWGRVSNPRFFLSRSSILKHFSSSSARGPYKKLRCRLDRVSCFRHEEKKSPLIGEDSKLFEPVPEELEDSTMVDRSIEGDGNWILHIRKIQNKIFTLQTESWTVPWTFETIVQVMLLWISSFWFVGSWVIPFLAHIAGFNKQSLTYRGQALYSLVTDITAGLAGITILRRCLSRFRPLPSGWFHISLKGTWYLDVILACSLFPVVNFLTNININIIPVLPPPSLGISGVEQSIVARDPVAMALYALVVSVCAPIWEEILFRGFLLPSLTRYMSLPWSIVVSSVGFALAHFNVQRVLPLVLLGVVKGVVFSRSRNLLASMLVHSLWNGPCDFFPQTAIYDFDNDAGNGGEDGEDGESCDEEKIAAVTTTQCRRYS